MSEPRLSRSSLPPSSSRQEAELSRLLDTFAATGLVLGLTVEELLDALPPSTPTPAWLPGCRKSDRDARAALLAPVLYRLGVVCEEASRWP